MEIPEGEEPAVDAELEVSQDGRDLALAAKSYASHFEDAREKVHTWKLTTGSLLVILVAGVGALIFFLLQSGVLVQAFVAVLLAGSVWSAYRLFVALNVFDASLGHAQTFAFALIKRPSREDFLELVRREVGPDESNVPEAIQQLAANVSGAEATSLAGRYAFNKVFVELGMVGFARGILVLGGLFGTVLFFSLELQQGAMTLRNLGELLAGLRGALACTLTGLAGSVYVSLLSSNIARHVELATTEFEAFLNAQVMPLLAQRRTRMTVRSEQDLWESLRQEVEHMTQATVTAYGRMGNDAATHVEALERLSRRLDTLPQVQWPENFDVLRTSLEGFAQSAQALSSILPRLIDTAAALNIYAPTKLIQDVERIDSAVQTQQGVLSDASQSVRDLSTQLSKEVVGIGVATDVVKAAAASVEAQQERTSQRLTDVSGRLGQTEQSVQELGLLLRSNQNEVSRLAKNVDSLRGVQGVFERVEKRLGNVDGMLVWHERASRAPLMQMMLAPLWNDWMKWMRSRLKG